MAGKWKGRWGVSGVSPYETTIAKHLGVWFEWPILSLAILIPFRLYFESKGRMAPGVAHLFDWVIWAFFVLETLLLSLYVRERMRYLRENWLNLVIIAVIFPPLWQYAPLPATLRLIRLLVLVNVFIRMVRIIYAFLRRNSLGTTLLASAIIIVISGILISAFDPAFAHPFEGIWWAWVTVSTVGYGDYVPVSTAGRIFAIFLILLGMGLFALLTAQISAALIGRVGRDLDMMEHEVRQLGMDEAAIHLHLERLERRLERIEHLLEGQLQKPLDTRIDGD